MTEQEEATIGKLGQLEQAITGEPGQPAIAAN